MRILILTTVFPPEVRSAAQIMFELAETLKNFGHQVVVLTSIPEPVEGEKRTFWQQFIYKHKVSGIDVIGISSLPIHRSNAPAIVRGVGQLVNGLAYFIYGVFLRKFDVSIAYSPPLTLGLVGLFLDKIRGIPHVFNVQDLVPQYAIDLGLLTNKTLIRLVKTIEHFVYRNVQVITVHSQGNKDYLLGEGVPQQKVAIVPNWVDPDIVTPGPKDNEFRSRNNLQGKFVVLFAGVLGFAQDLDTIIESASFLRCAPEIIILIVGEGVEKERLQKKAVSLGLSNVVFHAFVSKEQYPEVVAASNVCLASLHKSLKCPVIPSKILGYMSGARPVITSLSLEGDAPHVINNAGCGICVEPGEPQKLAEAILRLHNDPERCDAYGANGRVHTLQFYSRTECIRKYEQLFEALIQQKNKFPVL